VSEAVATRAHRLRTPSQPTRRMGVALVSHVTMGARHSHSVVMLSTGAAAGVAVVDVQAGGSAIEHTSAGTPHCQCICDAARELERRERQRAIEPKLRPPPLLARWIGLQCHKICITFIHHTLQWLVGWLVDCLCNNESIRDWIECEWFINTTNLQPSIQWQHKHGHYGQHESQNTVRTVDNWCSISICL